MKIIQQNWIISYKNQSNFRRVGWWLATSAWKPKISQFEHDCYLQRWTLCSACEAGGSGREEIKRYPLLLHCELSTSVKENPDRKKKKENLDLDLVHAFLKIKKLPAIIPVKSVL